MNKNKKQNQRRFREICINDLEEARMIDLDPESELHIEADIPIKIGDNITMQFGHEVTVITTEKYIQMQQTLHEQEERFRCLEAQLEWISSIKDQWCNSAQRINREFMDFKDKTVYVLDSIAHMTWRQRLSFLVRPSGWVVKSEDL